MKKLIAIIVLSLISVSASFAGENPKLFKEINRKLKLDASQLNLSKVHKNYVVVKFKIVNGEIEILGAVGSKELRQLIVNKLEEMDIDSESKASKVYRYKFNFRAEGQQ
ncbi:MAG: hypothetical protein P8P74_13130 [Crocinitomicaceae bacterium]|nr:hypothetical protein [Crocinitomicaceae bacterium]